MLAEGTRLSPSMENPSCSFKSNSDTQIFPVWDSINSLIRFFKFSLYAISPLLRAERAGHRLQLKNPAKNRYSCSLLGFIRSNIVFAISYKVKQLFICIYLVCALSFVFWKCYLLSSFLLYFCCSFVDAVFCTFVYILLYFVKRLCTFRYKSFVSAYFFFGKPSYVSYLLYMVNHELSII